MDQIIYHGSCPDGWASAYIAKMKYPEAELMPRDHGTEPPYDAATGRDILVLDFSWRTREQNDKMASLANSFHIYDHHRTAQEVLKDATYATFDMNRSGAGLTWDYLFGGERPWYISYTEDRDLWRFKLPDSREINQYIMTFPYTIEDWTRMTQVSLPEAAQAGQHIQLQIDKYVREAVKLAQHGHLNLNNKRYSVAVVNVPYLNTSEVGEALAYGSDIGLGWFERSDGMIQFSVRSRGDVDVSEVAKQFKGGGHTHAAGFQLSVIQGRNLIDTILNRNLVAYRYIDRKESESIAGVSIRR